MACREFSRFPGSINFSSGFASGSSTPVWTTDFSTGCEFDMFSSMSVSRGFSRKKTSAFEDKWTNSGENIFVVRTRNLTFSNRNALMLGLEGRIEYGKQNETGICCCPESRHGCESCFENLTGNQIKYVI